MGLIADIFTWWNGATLSTKLYTRAKGQFAGEDSFGNKYYTTPDPKSPLGKPRRWVIYNGVADPSKVPPEWHGWLHQTVEAPPTEEDYKPRPWQKPHMPNMTGSALAYKPSGATPDTGHQAKPPADYVPWRAE
jgi:NADH:ubiquinone oxidoreductase subunit